MDECGVCNGEGAVFECGCSDIADGFCDCDGSVLDCSGECGGSAVVDECGVCNGEGYSLCLDGSEVCDLSDCPDSIAILYNTDSDIAGFQFDVDGVDVLGAYGGASEDVGFTVSTSEFAVIGFSLTGTVVPPGVGILTNLLVNGNFDNACLSDLIVSDSLGQAYSATVLDCTTIVVDEIETCADPDACNTGQDGTCEYTEENFDCDGNCLLEFDCNGICGGGAIVDACGECGGAIEDESFCPMPGFMLSFGDYDLDNQSVDIVLNNESFVSGFQFQISGLEISGIESLSLANYDFSVYNSESTIIGFSLSGDSIVPSNSSVIRIFFENDFSSQFCINNPILSGPEGESLDVSVGDCLNIAGCTDESACNYGDYEYSCENCCNYGEQYWLDTDGDGLGYAPDEVLFCEDPGSPWVQNHGDEYPNCASNYVDECGDCDGDNSACSGCLDESAFNYHCLNGSWPTSATFGCDDDVVVADDSCLYPPDGFEFNQSTKQAFYKFTDSSFGGEPLAFMGSWIGAFKDDVCVGSWPWVGEFTTVPVMGDDGEDYSEGYLLDGEYPEFYVYDIEMNTSFAANLSNNYEWSDLAIYHVDLISVEEDCEGVIGGNQVYDECGICGGDGFLDNCLGTDSCDEMDCFGVCGGTDSCDVSDSNNWSDYGFFIGDVNADFQTNVTDITNQIGFIVGAHSPNEYQLWAADFNEDLNVNVVDVVNLSMHIVGLAARPSVYSEAYIQNNSLNIEGLVAGIQLNGGNLISDISDEDIIVSGNNKTIIYNLSGEIVTKEFEFDIMPEDIMVSDSNGDLLNISVISSFGLNDAYPNPFNPSTSINFSIDVDSYVSIKVYNMQGREIDSIASSYFKQGNHTLKWNADKFSSGVYIVKMISGNLVDSKKIMLVK